MNGEKTDRPSVLNSESSKLDIPVIDVRNLMANLREVVLIHDGERYRLRITAKNKLLLTK